MSHPPPFSLIFEGPLSNEELKELYKTPPPCQLWLTIDELTMPKTIETPSKNKKLPKVPNSWILFRKNYCAGLEKSQPGKKFHVHEVSKSASKAWEDSSIKVKTYFAKLSNKARTEFERLYGDSSSIVQKNNSNQPLNTVQKPWPYYKKSVKVIKDSKSKRNRKKGAQKDFGAEPTKDSLLNLPKDGKILTELPTIDHSHTQIISSISESSITNEVPACQINSSCQSNLLDVFEQLPSLETVSNHFIPENPNQEYSPEVNLLEIHYDFMNSSGHFLNRTCEKHLNERLGSISPNSHLSEYQNISPRGQGQRNNSLNLLPNIEILADEDKSILQVPTKQFFRNGIFENNTLKKSQPEASSQGFENITLSQTEIFEKNPSSMSNESSFTFLEGLEVRDSLGFDFLPIEVSECPQVPNSSFEDATNFKSF
ncbi:hypothetical protein G9A89_000947 [Geosiphon pyriformis]|nr:hypothetical protein G9A89_000947 [Geosiphon pyriformis]